MPSSQSKILTAGDMSGILHSEVLDLGEIDLGSIQAIYTGAPVGNLTLELSNDIIALGGDPNSLVANWTVYAGSSQAIAAAGNFIYNISNMGYKWLRMVWTPSSGTGVLNATAMVKNE